VQPVPAPATLACQATTSGRNNVDRCSELSREVAETPIEGGDQPAVVMSEGQQVRVGHLLMTPKGWDHGRQNGRVPVGAPEHMVRMLQVLQEKREGIADRKRIPSCATA